MSDGWTTVVKSFKDTLDQDMINPPPREIKLRIDYDHLIETGEVRLGEEW